LYKGPGSTFTDTFASFNIVDKKQQEDILKSQIGVIKKPEAKKVEEKKKQVQREVQNQQLKRWVKQNPEINLQESDSDSLEASDSDSSLCTSRSITNMK